MRVDKFIRSFFEGLKRLYDKPSLILFGLLLWVVFEGVSVLGRMIAPSLQSTWSNVAWTVAVVLISFLLGAYVLVGMIGVTKGKKQRESFFQSANRFWINGFTIILLMAFVGFLIGRAAHYGAFFIGRAFGFEVSAASVVFILIYFAGLVGVLIFLTFAHFFLVYEKLSLKKAIFASTRFVKKEYLATLSLNVAFFVLFYLVGRVQGVWGEVLLFGILLPYFVSVAGRFVEKR